MFKGAFWKPCSVPSTCFWGTLELRHLLWNRCNDFGFEIALARRRGANFLEINFQKCFEHAAWCLFFIKNRSHAQAWCKFCRCQLPKVLQTHGVLTNLTSEPLSRAGVVQILSMSTSKSAPTPPVFNDFDFRIALARRRGANFVDVNFQKCSDTASF